MAYDPADLRLPHWLLRFFDALVRLRLPLGRGLSIGMTRPGVLLSGAIAGLWLAAFYSGNNLLYLCGAMLTSLAVASVLRGILLLRSMTSLREFSWPRLEAGEATVVRVEESLSSAVSAVVQLLLQGDGGRFELQLRIEPEVRQLRGRLQPAARGVFEGGRLIMSTTAPLGLFQLILSKASQQRLVVMPAAVPWNDMSQQFRLLQEGDEWRDLRAYAMGDSLARVHWRKAAMDAREWTVKRFGRHEEDAARQRLVVDLRLPAGMDAECFEELLGKAWFWLQERHAGVLVIGQRAFALADIGARQEAMLALAGARPESIAPAVADGPRLSLLEASL